MSKIYSTYANGSRTEFFDTFENYRSTVSSVTTEKGKYSDCIVRTGFDYNGKAIPASENGKRRVDAYKVISIVIFTICVIASFFLTYAGSEANSNALVDSNFMITMPVVRFVFSAIGIASILVMKLSKYRTEKN